MLYTMTEVDFILQRVDLIPGTLTEWEQGFIDSIREQRYAGRTLSDRQVATLARIWDKQN